MAADFWSNLTEAVQDLRDVVDVDDDESGPQHASEQQKVTENRWSHQASSASSGLPSQTSGSPSSLLLLRSRTSLEPALLTPEAFGFDVLYVYHYRFDAIFKVLHWPTAQALIERSRLETSPSSLDGCVLEAAVSFAAVCTLKPHEVADKEYLLHAARDRIESCLSGVDFITTTSLVVLQAFVIYLVRHVRSFLS